MPLHATHRSLATLITLGLVAAGTAALPTAAQAVDVTSHVVISEVYGGGGNSGAQYRNDFVELYNSGDVAQSVDGWSVQYASSAGASWAATPLTGSVPPGGFYLVQEAAGANAAGTVIALPTPDAAGATNLSATAGEVALVNTATALTGCVTACDSAAGVVDFLGFGAAKDSAGTPTAALSNTTSAQRTITPLNNTGNNIADFSVAAPTPGTVPAGPPPPTCQATPLPPQCVPGPTTIQDVQGDGFLSPLKGDTVERVPGIVTARRTSGKSQGFWMQDPSPSADTSASAGLFVFTSTAAVAVGDSVLVTGKVADFYTLASGETLATTSSLSDTEIDPTTITTISSANALPAPVVLTPANVPALYAPSPAGGNIETITTVDPTHSVLEFFEAHEGMLVEVDNARVIGPADKFGELYVTDKPDEQVTPRGGSYIAGYDSPPTGRLLVQPVTGIVPPANTGDELVGATSGPVEWSQFGGYDLAATTVGAYQNNGLLATTATPQANDQLAVATYNVENLAPTDPQSKFDRLAAGVVGNLKSPDIISVEEIQDNDGSIDDGVVAADQTISKLTTAIAGDGGPTYSSSEIDPVNDADGGQPGGNIRVVFLYNPLRVTFVSKPGGDATTAVSVSTGTDGTPELSVSPGRVDPTNPAWTSSRKPLAGEFVFQDKKVIVVGNHFDAKLGDQNADGRFQPPTRSSEIQRNEQATALNGFVKQVLAADPRANLVLAGDFNDYQFSQPIQTLTDSGATLTDEINTLPVNQRYTYVFDGVSQVLDHIFVSRPLSDSGSVEYDVIHANAEFSDQVSDHDPQVVRIRPVPHQVPTTLTLTSSAPTSVLGTAVRFTATPSSGGGTVSFTVDGTPLGSPVPVASDAAVSAPTTGLTPGAHTVTATYSGDIDDAGSTATITEYVEYAVRVLLPTGPARAGDPLVLAFQLTDANGHAITDAQAKALGCRVTVAGSGAQSLPGRCATYVGGLRLFGTIWLTSKAQKGPETVVITITYPGAPAQLVTVPVGLR